MRRHLGAVELDARLRRLRPFGITVANSAPMLPRRISDIDWANWKATDIATLVFVHRDERLLLIHKKRGLGAGKINGPGGRVEPGETLEACAVREVQEELRITPKNLEKSGELRFQFVDGYAIHVHVFRATDFEGTPSETPEAIPIWVDEDRIPYEEMWGDDRIWLPRLIAGTPFAGRFIFDSDVMLDHELV
jgi:8-oxo-dGTP diphosphatase